MPEIKMVQVPERLVEAVDNVISARENWRRAWEPGNIRPSLDEANDRLDEAFNILWEIRRQMRVTKNG